MKKFREIINHNYFKWLISLIILAWVAQLFATKEDTIYFGIGVSRIGIIVATTYYWFQANREKDIKYKLAGILLALFSLVPFGIWFILFMMYNQIKKLK